MQKDKCPDCKGSGRIGKKNRYEQIPIPSDFHCYTCNGTGEKKLDRPRLISRARAESAVPLEDCSGQKYGDGLREDIIRYVLYGAELQRDADHLHYIALFPDIEEATTSFTAELKYMENVAKSKMIIGAKREERERIRPYVQGAINLLFIRKYSATMKQLTKTLEALKEE